MQLRLDIPIVIPKNEDCAHCRRRLQGMSTRLKGVESVELSEKDRTLRLRFDPDLTSASIMGANAILRVGGRTGMVLAALGPDWQVTEIPDLLRCTNRQGIKPRWNRLFNQALANEPSVEKSSMSSISRLG